MVDEIHERPSRRLPACRSSACGCRRTHAGYRSWYAPPTQLVSSGLPRYASCSSTTTRARIDARRNRDGTIQHERCVDVRVGDRRCRAPADNARASASPMMSTGLPCDHAARQHGIELGHRFRRQLREATVSIEQTVRRENAEAAAVRDDREPIPARDGAERERLDRVEQIFELEHAQHAGAAERGVVYRVGSGQRAAVRSRRARAFACRPDLQTITGLPRAAARAADMNLRACVIASTYSRIAVGGFVARRDSRACRRSRRRPCRRATTDVKSRCRACWPNRAPR